MVTLGKTCRTANGADCNFEERYRENIKSIIKTGEMKCDTLLSAAQKDGRGNICPATIILPTLAMNAGRDVEKFMVLLEKKIGETKDMLIERFNWICKQSADSAKFMYENGTMAGYISEEGIKSALAHGTLAIGQLGLAETLLLLIGKDQTTEEGMELAKRIEKLFQYKCNEYKTKYKLNFGVYYTPAESLCHTAMKNFRKIFSKEIDNASEGDVLKEIVGRDYFTNSIHVPVWKEVSPFEKVDVESELTGYSNAGCITYVELPSTTMNNIDALETLIVYELDKDVPYIAINVPVDFCNHCGYSGEFEGPCPHCGGNEIERLRRVTGYLSTTYEHFNPGKIAETRDRVKHVKN